MFMTLKRDWHALEGPTEKDVIIPKGRHEIERIPYPGTDKSIKCFWLVLKGTKVGGGEGSWRQWNDAEGDMKIIIEEDDKI